MDDREYYDPVTGKRLDEWQEGCEVYKGDSEDEVRMIGEAEGYDAIRQRVSCWDRRKTRFALEKTFWIEVAGEDIALNGRVFLRPGHYEAANLDWTIFADGMEEMDGEMDGYAMDVAEQVLDYSRWNEGLKAMNRAKVAGRIHKALKAVANELDDFCRRTCTGVYGISVVYGNGEVEYSRI